MNGIGLAESLPTAEQLDDVALMGAARDVDMAAGIGQVASPGGESANAAPGAEPGGPLLDEREQPTAEARQKTVEFFRGGLQMVFDSQCPAWGFQKNQVGPLAECTSDMVLHYWPKGIDMVGPVVGCFIVWVAIVGPYLKKPRFLDANGNPIEKEKDGAGEKIAGLDAGQIVRPGDSPD